MQGRGVLAEGFQQHFVCLASCVEIFAEKFIPVGEEAVGAVACGLDAHMGVVGDGDVALFLFLGIVGCLGEGLAEDVFGEGGMLQTGIVLAVGEGNACGGCKERAERKPAPCLTDVSWIFLLVSCQMQHQ